jgi:hypothetical protein
VFCYTLVEIVSYVVLNAFWMQRWMSKLNLTQESSRDFSLEPSSPSCVLLHEPIRARRLGVPHPYHACDAQEEAAQLSSTSAATAHLLCRNDAAWAALRGPGSSGEVRLSNYNACSTRCKRMFMPPHNSINTAVIVKIRARSMLNP